MNRCESVCSHTKERTVLQLGTMKRKKEKKKKKKEIKMKILRFMRKCEEGRRVARNKIGKLQTVDQPYKLLRGE